MIPLVALLTIALVLGGCEEQVPTAAAGTGVLQPVQGSKAQKLSAPVSAGQFPKTSGDPTILMDDGKYRMFFTTPNLERLQGAIGQAVSDDGENWTLLGKSSDAGEGIVLLGEEGDWDEQLETAYAINYGGKYLLYYCGYPKVGWPENPGRLGLATSTNGVDFERVSDKPILEPTPEGYDANGLYSPVVVEHGGMLKMLYAGHVYQSSKVTPGIYILGATSKDGVHWTKLGKPVLSPSPKLPWMEHGVAEPALIKGRDGFYYLFVTGGLGDHEKRVIGVARGNSPFGPWEVLPDPVLTPTPGHFDERGNGILAPTVVEDGDRLRLWYLTSFVEGDSHMIGYAEFPWPIEDWKGSLPF